MLYINKIIIFLFVAFQEHGILDFQPDEQERRQWHSHQQPHQHQHEHSWQEVNRETNKKENIVTLTNTACRRWRNKQERRQRHSCQHPHQYQHKHCKQKNNSIWTECSIYINLYIYWSFCNSSNPCLLIFYIPKIVKNVLRVTSSALGSTKFHYIK